MVSLSNQNTPAGGFFGFSEERRGHFSTNSDDELLVDENELVSNTDELYKPIGTTWAIIVNKILFVSLCAVAFLIPNFCVENKCGEDPISMIMYIHGGIWFFFLGLDKYLLSQHTKNRRDGYLQFYRRTKNIRGLSFLINSCANAVIVIIIKGVDQHFGSKDKCNSETKTLYLQIIIAVESALAIISLIIYFVLTVQFNSRKPSPDVTQEELMTSYVNSQSYSDMGYKNENYVEQVMERQADMIRYLRQHSETLARRNLMLQEELNKFKVLGMQK